VVACEGSRRSNHKHGVEPNFTSKFWANGDSSSDSEDEDALSVSDTNLSTPTLKHSRKAFLYIKSNK
jgi:hypothetical protein